jgi:hypothetical protein
MHSATAALPEVGVVGVMGIVGVVVLLLLPPQPTANTKAEIKMTKPIVRTFSPYRMAEVSTPWGTITGM